MLFGNTMYSTHEHCFFWGCQYIVTGSLLSIALTMPVSAQACTESRQEGHLADIQYKSSSNIQYQVAKSPFNTSVKTAYN